MTQANDKFNEIIYIIILSTMQPHITQIQQG
jgi:hypothetical protein